MTIIGLGSDIVDIERITRIIERSGKRLADRILSTFELQKYQFHNQPARFLAKRFAVKEAAAKALGTGICKGLSFKDFEIYNNILGKPHIRFFEQADLLASQLGIKQVHVTLTDERHYACAIVIIEG